MKVKSFSHVQLFVTLWTVAFQALLSMGFSRQESWSESPFPSSGDLPDPGIEPGSPALLSSELPGKIQILVTQSCPTLRDPVDCSLPGSTVRGILQARVLE